MAILEVWCVLKALLSIAIVCYSLHDVRFIRIMDRCHTYLAAAQADLVPQLVLGQGPSYCSCILCLWWIVVCLVDAGRPPFLPTTQRRCLAVLPGSRLPHRVALQLPLPIYRTPTTTRPTPTPAHPHLPTPTYTVASPPRHPRRYTLPSPTTPTPASMPGTCPAPIFHYLPHTATPPPTPCPLPDTLPAVLVWSVPTHLRPQPPTA